MNMNIYEEENKLFAEWGKGRIGFVADGVVSEKCYLNAPTKICFVLKEVNDKDGAGWDLRKFIHSGAREQTWDNIARWVKCIGHIEQAINWNALKNITKDDRKAALRSICAMNLKKAPGGHTTNPKIFSTAVRDDKEFINKQYSLYNPDITICCGTGSHLQWILDLDKEKVYETTRGIQWFLNSESKPIIIYNHPNARIAPSLLVYGLVDAVREINQKI